MPACSLFGLISPVELQALFHSKLLNHRDRAFQFLSFQECLSASRQESFCLCLSHVWEGNNLGDLPLLPEEFKVPSLISKVSIDLGTPCEMLWSELKVVLILKDATIFNYV